MFRVASAFALGVSIALILMLAPVAPAQAAGPAMVGFFLDEGKLSFAPPVGTAVKSRSITADANPQLSTPALGTLMSWGGISFPNSIAFASDGVMTFWLTSNGNAAWNEIRVDLYKDTAAATATTSFVSGITGKYADQGTTARNAITTATSLKLTVGVSLNGQSFKAGETLRIGFTFWGLAGAAAPGADVLVQYGAASKAAGLVVGVKDPGAVPTLGELAGFYLADAALSLTPPTGAVDKERDSTSLPGSGTTLLPVPGGAIALASQMEWGKVTTTAPIVLTYDSVVTVHLRMASGAAGATRGLRVNLFVADTNVATESMNLRAFAHSSTTAITKITVGLPTAGLKIGAGQEVKLTFQLWSTNQPEVAKMVYVYGSTVRASGLYYVGAGGAAPPPLASSTEASESESNSTAAMNATAAPSATSANTTASQATNATAQAAGDSAGSPKNAKDVVPPGAAIPALGWAATAALMVVFAVAFRRR